MAEVRRVGSPFPDPKERCPAILVVEDEVLIRLVIADYLRECGFKVYEAGSAEEAIVVLESDQAAVDLIFSDIRLPGEMNGFALAQWARTNRPGLPVVLTSGDSKKSEAAKELCENEPFFAKPYDVQLVVTQIRTIIDAKTRKGGGD
jgi:CheY-like chemotaxis protein